MHGCKYDHQSSLVTCPFFRGHTVTDIGCEGITDETTIRLLFKNKQSRNRHEEIFCADKYTNCELYRAIMEKYEED